LIRAFNDVLRGGFGGREADSSSGGDTRTARGSVWASAVPAVEAMRRGERKTLFDVLVKNIHEHGDGGSEAEEGVDLELC